jgi:hypothetical protein
MKSPCTSSADAFDRWQRIREEEEDERYQENSQQVVILEYTVTCPESETTPSSSLKTAPLVQLELEL